MSIHSYRSLKVCVSALLLMSASISPEVSLAQDEGMTFEHAQTRTAYARKQMNAMRQELEDAEAREEKALRELDEMKRNQLRALGYVIPVQERRKAARDEDETEEETGEEAED